MGRFQRFSEKIRQKHRDQQKKHEEFHKYYDEYEKKNLDFYRKKRELLFRLKEIEWERERLKCSGQNTDAIDRDIKTKKKEIQKLVYGKRQSKAELYRMHKHFRWTPYILLGVNVFIWYVVYRFAGIQVLSIVFAVLISIGGIFQFFMLRKIQKKILTPIGKLIKGVDEISKGNYHVMVEGNVRNEIGTLIEAFNKMAQKLEEGERVKSEYEENRKALIANISHDLKTPITSIQGYIEAITDEKGVSQDNLNKYLKIIYNNTAYMNKLIDDLFLFSKLDMQKLDFKFEQVKVRPFLNDLMEEFRLELEEKKIDFSYKDQLEEDFYVNIDMKRLNQVFRNVIGNSVKYGPEVGLSIKVKLLKQGALLHITIADNGSGISKDKLPYIFDRFYRVDTERTKDFMSTGLGLAIAKELINAHHGNITAESGENKGTCFTLILPIAE